MRLEKGQAIIVGKDKGSRVVTDGLSKNIIGKYNKSMTERGDNIVDVFKRFIAMSVGATLSFIPIGYTYKGYDGVPYMYLLGIVLIALITNRYRKRKQIIWKAHLTTLSVSTSMVFSYIAREVFDFFGYVDTVLISTLGVVGIITILLGYIGLYVTDRYYEFGED